MKKMSGLFLFILLSVFESSQGETLFDQARDYFESGSTAELSDFRSSQTFLGSSFYSNNPNQSAPFYNLIYLENGNTYFNKYFANATTAGWGLNEFINAFKKIQPTQGQLQPSQDNALILFVVQGGFTKFERKLRKLVNEETQGITIVDEFRCRLPSGCDVPYDGTNFHHYQQNEVISYGYFNL